MVRFCDGSHLGVPGLIIKISSGDATWGTLVPMTDRVVVHSTTVPMEADFVRMVLVDHGIECSVENEGAVGYAIGIPSTAAPLLLSVPEKQAETARQLVCAALRTMKLPVSSEPLPMQSLPCACGRVLEVPEGSVRQTIDCPYCGRAVEIGGTNSPGAQPSRDE